MKKITVKFEGIDSFNRPIFKGTNTKERFGSLDKLFDYDATEKTVLNEVDEIDLYYFGNFFGCEPIGTPPGDIEII